MGKVRLLNILIIVAAMGFSMRFVDVFSGVSTLVTSAYAENEEVAPVDKESDAPIKIAEESSNPDEGEQDAEGESLEISQEGDESDAPIFDEEIMDWRDASDSDMEMTATRMEMFRDLAERRKELDEREKSLATQQALLQAAEKELDRKYEELDRLRTEIEGLLDKQKTEEKDRIDSLVKIYETMKPKDAARIFNTLDLDVLVSVFSKMSERRLSPILANMTPERARTVTILLAEEKSLPSLPGR